MKSLILRQRTVYLLVAALVPLAALRPHLAVAQTAPARFSDIQNYWGRSFIQALADRNIVSGYPDNTYRPEQPVARDEFAAVLRQAFSQPPERQLSSGAVYSDVSQDSWAEPAIEEASEMGFMQGFPNGEFRPNQSLTKAEAVNMLAQNLDLPAAANPNQVTGQATGQTPQASPAQPSAQQPAQQPIQQPNRRRNAKRPLMFPLASTLLMQPLMANPVRAAGGAANVVPGSQPTAPQATAPQPASPESPDPQPAPQPTQSPAETAASALPTYYEDAAQIPPEAVEGIAQATAAGIIVNYPNPQVLNPTQPATRGEVAALIHQALVRQGRLEPLPSADPAANYIVGR